MADPDLDVALHKAVYDALLADAGLIPIVGKRVYDKVPGAAPQYPYIVIDSVEIGDDATTCSDASEVHVTVRAVSNMVGSIEAKRMGGFIRRALGTELTIAGHRTSVGAFDIGLPRAGDRPELTEYVTSFTYLVDPS